MQGKMHLSRMRQHLYLFIWALLTAVTLTACGGGNDTSGQNDQ